MSRTLAALILFGLSFGLVEAATVIYLRGHYEPIHQRAYPSAAAGDLFPILTPAHVDQEGESATRLMVIELTREAGTMVMMAAVAWAVARSFQQWFAAFLLVFGTWDISYYLFLKVFIDWPASLLTWDLLFLLPVPWVGPVLAPLLIAVTMVLAGGATLYRDIRGRPIAQRPIHWLAVLGGGILIIFAFCWDYRNILAGGYPNEFFWPLFLLGLGISGAAFLHALWFGPSRAQRLPQIAQGNCEMNCPASNRSLE